MIRITPEEIFRFGLSEVRTEDVKFGVPVSQLRTTAERLRDCGVTHLGLHAYLSGNTLNAEYYPKLARLLCETAKTVSDILPVSYLNISGGLGIGYHVCTKKICSRNFTQFLQFSIIFNIRIQIGRAHV